MKLMARYRISGVPVTRGDQLVGIVTNRDLRFETDMTKKLQEDPKLREIYEGRILLGRFGRTEDVTPAFVFMASSESDYITGQVLSVDGGTVL